MSTDLFTKYYTDPKRQYIYTNMSCKSEGETNFTVSGDAAVINDGNTELASLDLSSIKEYITDWNNETRIVEPYEFCYFKGFSSGLAYQRNVFIQIPEEIMKDKDFEYLSDIEFTIKYFKCGTSHTTTIKGVGNLDTLKTFIEDAQEKIDTAEIPVEIKRDENAIIITSTVLGYDFYVDSDIHTNCVKFHSTIIPDPSVDPSTGTIAYLYDYKEGFVAPKKYRNGAFRGVVIKPTYPQFNDAGIDETQLSLKIAHLKNRIEYDIPIKVGQIKLYDKIVKDVVDSYNEIEEINEFHSWNNPNNGCSTIETQIKNNSNITGLYGFINWTQKHNEWNNFGALYAIVTPKDTVDTNDRNLIDSFVVYNPNPFPVKLSCMLFA